MSIASKNGSLKRAKRVRSKLKKHNSSAKPRIIVFRSNKNLYAQLFDDKQGAVLCSSSSLDPKIKKDRKKNVDISLAELVGKDIAEKAIKLSVKEVVFDKGRYSFHGQVKSLADGARSNGLSF